MASFNRLAAAIIAIVVLIGGVGIALAASHGSSSKSSSHVLRAAAAERLADRLQANRSLARDGVFVELADPAVRRGVSRCVKVQLLNPTAANRAYLSQKFGDRVCVSSTPIGPAEPGDACLPQSKAGHRVTVPNLVGLAPFAAYKRARAAGLVLAGCAGDKPTRKPDPYSPDNALLVTKQCPKPGALARRDSGISLDAVGHLPGGYIAPGPDYGRTDFC